MQERIVTEPDPRNDVAGTESDLLCLGEEFVHATSQGHLPDVLNGDELFGPDLGRVENVKVELVLS